MKNGLLKFNLSKFMLNLLLVINFSFINSQVNSPLQVFTKKQNGINLIAKDSIFSCQFQFRMQNRLAYESKSETDFTPESFEFRVRRLRLKMQGFIYNPKWNYKIQLAFSRGDMDWESNKSSNINTSVNIVRDAVITYQWTKDFGISFGQTKLPGNRQRVISSGDQQFVDRSIVNGIFTIDRDFGLFLNFEKPYFKLKGAVTSGEGRNSTKSNKGLSYTGRIEVLPFGAFTGKNDYVEGDLEREQKPKLSIGASYNYNSFAVRNGGQLGEDLFSPRHIHNLHGDLLFKFKGFAFYNESCLRLTENPITYNSDTTKFVTVFNGYGNLTQISYLFKNNFEIAVRYVFVNPYSSIFFNKVFTSINTNKQDQIHLGLTKYLNGHRLKVQFNVAYLMRKDYQLNKNFSKVGAYFQIEMGI
jgi:phosphate-selective porin OprO/OprP